MTIDVPSTATVVINVDGKNDFMRNFGFTLKGGIDVSHILFNFYEAKSLTLSGIGIEGTILAPSAGVKFNNGRIHGSLIADTLSGSGTTLNNRFAGSIPVAAGAVPEPSSLLMVLTGSSLGIVFALSARKKACGGEV